jgi:DNA-binding GntR family transcriptional regulator
MSRATSTSADAVTLVDTAYSEIRRHILDNLWPPGYQALEQEVALQLGMSRTPVHEALIRLCAEGLVEVIPRRGMRVLPLSANDMREIYEIIGSLESTAAEILAARKPSEAELRPLLLATQAMAKALDQDDLDAWAKADENFHLHLVRLAGNKRLAETVMSYWDRVHRARMFTLRLRPKPVHSTQDHMELVEKLRQGDPAGAAAVNRSHRARASQELLAIFGHYRMHQL